MDPWIIGAIGFAAMITLVMLGVPIFAALGIIGIAGLTLTLGFGRAIEFIGSMPYTRISSYILAALPLFYLMGEIAAAAGMGKDAYFSANKLTTGMRGGLAMATTLGSGISAAAMGSSLANTAMFTKIALPEMDKHGYDRAFSSGCVAASGTFAGMIPPSLGLIIYCLLTDESIGRVLIAGIIPGAITILFYMASIYVRCKWLNKKLAPEAEESVSFKERIFSLRHIWAIAALFGLVMGGIYFGIFPPSAGGAVGASGAFIIALARRKLNWKNFKTLTLDTVRGCAAILFILIGGMLFARFLVLSGFVERMVDVVTTLGVTPLIFVVIVVIVYTILGALMDPLPMRVITVPFFYPMIIALGMSGIWFGIIVQKMVEIGMITPPIGLNLFVLTAADEKLNLTDVIRGIWPFLMMDYIVLALLVAFPSIALFLPNLMIG